MQTSNILKALLASSQRHSQLYLRDISTSIPLDPPDISFEIPPPPNGANARR
jgi:hypothetical protein